MTEGRRRHQALAGETRERILAVLAAAGRPLGTAELAGAIGRHPNSVREQLEHLRAVGMVERTVASAGGRGRPAFRHAVRPGADAATHAPGSGDYRSLAAVLADQVALLPNAVEASITAGERWGHALVVDDQAPEGDAAAVARLVAILGEAGFQPERGEDDETVILRRCPFEAVARAHPGVICGVHLGMIRGALAALRSTVDVVRLDPFVTPDTCLALLAPRRVDPGEGTA